VARSELTVNLAGKAWSGAGDVTKVELSFDNGNNWLPTSLSAASNTHVNMGLEFSVVSHASARLARI
jgi:hypothetical protein